MNRDKWESRLSPQLPRVLSRFDDPRGVVWRIYNAVRRFDARRAGRVLAGLFERIDFEKPVFILGASRSGTTLVFRFLSAASELGALPREGHDLWRAFHHPRYSRWRSDVVGAGKVLPGEQRFVAAYLRSYFQENRFVEKTPENSFRVPYLLDLFPDARFLVVWRNPLLVLRSLIRGWSDPAGRFRSYFVPEDLHIPGYPHRRMWCFALIEGWRELRSASIPEIAFAQWEAFVRAIYAAKNLVPPERWKVAYLEHLVNQPDKFGEAICRFAEVEFDQPMADHLKNLVSRPVYALPEEGDATREDKEIEELIPKIRTVVALSGYSIERRDDRWQAFPSADGAQ